MRVLLPLIYIFCLGCSSIEVEPYGIEDEYKEIVPSEQLERKVPGKSWNPALTYLGEVRDEKGRPVKILLAFSPITDEKDFINNIQMYCGVFDLRGYSFFVFRKNFHFEKEPYRSSIANYSSRTGRTFPFESNIVGWYDSEDRILFYNGKKIDKLSVRGSSIGCAL